MTPTVAEQIKVTRRVFNLDTCEVSKKEAQVPFTPVTSLQEALARSDNKEAKLLETLNAGFKRDVKISGRAGITLADNEAPVSAVNGFIKSFLPMFSGIKDKDEQKKAAVAFVRSNAQLVEALKAYAAANQEDDEDGAEA